MKLLLLLSLTLGCWRLANAEEDNHLVENLWKKYKQIFHSTLDEAISSPYTLEELHINNEASNDETSRIQLGCADYLTGERLATEARSISSEKGGGSKEVEKGGGSTPSLRPLAVMKSDDYMCFMAIDNADNDLSPIVKQFDFFLDRYPAPLKIHKSVYDLIMLLSGSKATEDTLKQVGAVKDNFLSISYRHELFTDEAPTVAINTEDVIEKDEGPLGKDEVQGQLHDDQYYFPKFSETDPKDTHWSMKNRNTRAKGERYFNSHFNRLDTYNAQSLFNDRFFWTSRGTSKFFEDTKEGEWDSSPLLEKDREHHLFLTNTARKLTSASASATFSSTSAAEHTMLGIQSLCGFQGLTTSEFLGQGSVRIPLSILLQQDEETEDTSTLSDDDGPKIDDDPYNPSLQKDTNALETLRPTASSCLLYLTAYLAHLPEVTFIAIEQRPQLFNYRARSVCQTTVKGSAKESNVYTAAGLNGELQIVGVSDTGLEEAHCFFYDETGRVQASPWQGQVIDDLERRKIVQYVVGPQGDTIDTVSGHGSHVCGTVIGKKVGKSIWEDPEAIYDGVAPMGKVAFMDLSGPSGNLDVPGATDLLSPSYSAGARVHSNSWGSYFPEGSRGYYSGEEMDGYLYNYPEMAVFFSAGNEGAKGAFSINIYATAKNIVGVGSSQSSELDGNPKQGDISYVSFFSSQGPTYDDRFKPDLVAPGDPLTSAMANGQAQQGCDLTEKQGTSMACPATAGIAMLVRQYFEDVNTLKGTTRFWQKVCNPSYRSCGTEGVPNVEGFVPSGMLVKAILITGAVDMVAIDGEGGARPTSAPDGIQGYGRVALSNVLPLINRVGQSFDLFVDDWQEIGPNTVVEYTLSLQSAGDVVATLAWYDPPSVQGSQTRALIHNLDLCMVSPSGEERCGNTGTDQRDQVNNNERVIVAGAARGDWKVLVSASALPSSNVQAYALVITSTMGTVSYK